MNFNKLTLSFLLFISISTSIFAQGFLHASGTKIVNGKGENVILRGIGTGNWMIQEGYMMQSSDVANTQQKFKNKLIQTIGVERTDSFYNAWLHSHFTKTDVDSMAAWGFNSVRVALHYKWFTLPIEEETVAGQNTWLPIGFELVDSLLSWCEANEMYLILDMHGTPGGQGKDEAISDYDPTKPSLWESNANKDKLVALWQKLAERYSNSPWIGGYDLINEPNWTFPEGNNSQLRQIYGRLTDSIRKVDKNHLIIIEGNWFANDFSGLTPPWDANMAYSFHKYWSYNDATALDWVINLRSSTNRPIWLGETGENSNVWFTSLVALAEKNNIGWSWWPVKKASINNILKVTTNPDYTQLINYWKGQGTMTADAAYKAVMKFADAHKFENCTIGYDVIDALIRQPKTLATKPFKTHKTGQEIFAVDYDLGRNNEAYYDVDTADFHLNTDKFINWNQGWAYRNDGVDIEKCADTDTTNGFDVGWIETGEWLQFTINSDSAAAYKLTIRSASQSSVGNCHFEVDGKPVSKSITLPSTGGWATWKSTTVSDVILPKGEFKLKLVIDKSGYNLNYFMFTEPKKIEDVAFTLLDAGTHTLKSEILLNFNKLITTADTAIKISDFQVFVNNINIPVSSVTRISNNSQQLLVKIDKGLLYTDKIQISYTGTSLVSNNQSLAAIDKFLVTNKEIKHTLIPGQIQAESFLVNNGFNFEPCNDTGGGQNTSYANNGDYLDYLIYVPKEGDYNMDFRVATIRTNGEVTIKIQANEQFIDLKSLKFTNTNGWQTWQTQSTIVHLPAGKYIIRIYSKSGEYNLNWIKFSVATGIEKPENETTLNVYPNPANESVNITFGSSAQKLVELYDVVGKLWYKTQTFDVATELNVSNYPNGIYWLRVSDKNGSATAKILILR